VAEAYEEVVFRTWGASSLIRHDMDGRFVGEVFRHFREMMGMQQRSTMAYRQQANGQQERSVQSVVKSIRAYASEPDQSDWDEIAVKLMHALNTSYDHTRKASPAYLLFGWEPRSTISAMLGRRPGPARLRSAYEWRQDQIRQYEYARVWAEDLQAKAKRRRADAQTQRWNNLPDKLKQGFEVGDFVWLYLARVKPGLTKKLAHLWHGSFLIEDKSDEFRCKLRVQGSGYQIHPWVHVGRLKPRLLSEKRPTETLDVDEDDDWNAALLPGDSWEPEPDSDVYEVEAILDVRWSRSSRTTRRRKEYLVKWLGYDEPDWEPSHQLSAGRLLYEFDQTSKARARFQAMQSGDDYPDAETL